MIFCIEQEIFTIGDRFSIMDDQGNTLFLAESEIFTFGKKLHLYRASASGTAGEECAYIEEELFSFRPCYHITTFSPQETVTVINDFAFFSQLYSVPERTWQVTGDFFDHEYTIFENSRRVADVSKQWFTFGDCYRIDAGSEESALLVLCIALIIDCIDAKKK